MDNNFKNQTNHQKYLKIQFNTLQTLQDTYIQLLSTMEYRHLGPTGIKVSVISFGNWLNSDKPESNNKTTELVKTAWDNGINFFDTAEIYGFGEAERQMGEALKALNIGRNQFVVSTKIFKNDPAGKPNRVGLSRKHIIEGLRASLKNLQLDHVDVVFAHRPFYDVTMQEICRAFDWVIRKGWAHYWGTSQWDAGDIAEANAVCSRLNLIKPVVEQPQYNLVHRQRFQIEYERLFKTTGMGTTIWSPLAGGLLTGKYNQGLPADSRYEKFGFLNKDIFNKLFDESHKEESLKKFQKFVQIAKQLGGSQAQLAMAWCIYNKNVSTAITGASSSQQLIETCKSVELLKKFTPQIDRRIQEIFQTAPVGKFSVATLELRKSPRVVAFQQK